MLRRMHAQITLALPLVFVLACGGSQKKAEVPDFTEKGWSGASSDTPSEAKADPPIQSTPAKGDDAAMKADSAPAPASKPETSSGAESDVVSGNALPPSPNPTKAAAKPNKAKKTKTKKKKQQQS